MRQKIVEANIALICRFTTQIALPKWLRRQIVTIAEGKLLKLQKRNQVKKKGYRRKV